MNLQLLQRLVSRLLVGGLLVCLCGSQVLAKSVKKNQVYSQKSEQESLDSNNNWNFRFSPVGVLLGIVATDLDYKINDQIMVGPTFTYVDLKIADVTLSGTMFGVQGRHFFDSFQTDGWYLAGKGIYASYDASVTSSGTKYSGSASGMGFALTGGYHWFWDSFNLNLGAGVAASPGTTVELKDPSGNKYKDTASASSSFAIDFMIGWVF